MCCLAHKGGSLSQKEDNVSLLMEEAAVEGATTKLCVRVSPIAGDEDGVFATPDYRYNELLFLQVSAGGTGRCCRLCHDAGT